MGTLLLGGMKRADLPPRPERPAAVVRRHEIARPSASDEPDAEPSTEPWAEPWAEPSAHLADAPGPA